MPGVLLVDCLFDLPATVGAWLVHDGRQAMFIESGMTPSTPALLAALHGEGLSEAQVALIVVTHVHLDHAGGCHALARACPDATVLAHPRAIEHLVDPSRLVAGARAVYGAERFERLFGEIRPIPGERVRAVADGEEVAFGDGSLRFLHTLGHANHHVCVHVPALDGIFTGDSFGVAYPRLQRRGLFVFPSTSPTAFQPDEAIRSVRRIQETGARRAFLTHFGEVSDLPRAAGQLVDLLTLSRAVIEDAAASTLPDAELDSYCQERLEAGLEERARAIGLQFDEGDRAQLRVDMELNGAGVAHAARRRRQATGQADS